MTAESKSRRGPRCKVSSVWRAWQKKRRAARGGAGETAVPDSGETAVEDSPAPASFDAHGLAGETVVEDPPARALCFDLSLRHQGIITRKVTFADVLRSQHGLSHGFVYGRGGGVGSVSAKSTRAKREEPTRKKKRRPQSKVARDPAVRRVSDEDWAELCAACLEVGFRYVSGRQKRNARLRAQGPKMRARAIRQHSAAARWQSLGAGLLGAFEETDAVPLRGCASCVSQCKFVLERSVRMCSTFRKVLRSAIHTLVFVMCLPLGKHVGLSAVALVCFAYAMARLAAFAWPCHTVHCRSCTSAIVVCLTSLCVDGFAGVLSGAIVCCFLPRLCLWWPGDDDDADDVLETVAERASSSAGPCHQAEIALPVPSYSLEADDVRDGKLWLTRRDSHGWIPSRGVLKLDPAAEAQPPNVLRAVDVEYSSAQTSGDGA